MYQFPQTTKSLIDIGKQQDFFFQDKNGGGTNPKHVFISSYMEMSLSTVLTFFPTFLKLYQVTYLKHLSKVK